MLSPIKKQADKTFKKQLELLAQQGFTRIQQNGEVSKIEDFISKKFSEKEQIYVHELQNLVHALTGEELTLKQTDNI